MQPFLHLWQQHFLSEKETGNIIKKNSKKFIRQTISKETSNTMRRALENVVAKGSYMVLSLHSFSFSI